MNAVHEFKETFEMRAKTYRIEGFDIVANEWQWLSMGVSEKYIGHDMIEYIKENAVCHRWSKLRILLEKEWCGEVI